jgi:hypothetical protein
VSKCEPVETKSPFYYSLSGAVNSFGLTTNEIIDLAIKEEIVLSVKIPKEYTPYLMSVVEPEESKMCGFLYAKEALKGMSMLPREVYATYLNLSKADCEVLKTSTLEQSVFEGVFCDPPFLYSKYPLSNPAYSEHRLILFYNEWLSNLELNFDNEVSEVVRSNNYQSQQAEKLDKVPSIDRKRFINGVRALESGEYLRRFVIIDKYLAREVDEELEFDQGIEFLAGSELNQTFAKELIIKQSDVEISSNYKKALGSVTNIPEESPYFIKPELRDFNGLHALAEIGYQYFIVEGNSNVDPLKTILSTQVKSKKTIDAAVFFLNPKPHHKAGLHKLTPKKGRQCQLEHLLKESKEYWGDKNLGSQHDIEKQRKGFAEDLHELGYSHEKAIHGEFLSLPNKLRINEGIKVLNINKVFPKV